jgi:multiple sugar transport system substrate-binding protein
MTTPPKEMVTVKVNWWPGPESDAAAEVLKFWNENLADEMGIKTELVLFGREAHIDKLTSVLLAGSKEIDVPFMFYLVGRLYPYLEPLDDYFADPELYPYTMSDFFPAGIEQFKVNGKTYGVPTDVGVHVLLYRKDLIEKPPETLEELVSMAKQFSRKHNPDSPTEYGFIVSGKNLLFNAMLWESLWASAGGTPFTPGNELQAAESLTDEPAKRALQIYTDFIQEEVSPPESINFEYPQANAAFQAGQAAMYIQWNAAIGELRDPEKSPLVWDKVGIAPIPGAQLADGTVLHRSHSHYLGLGINKASDNKVEAFKFIAWLTTTRPMLIYLKKGGFPPIRSVFANPEAIAARTEIPELQPILDRYSFTMTNHAEVFNIYDILVKHLSAAWSGQTSVDSALSAAREELVDLLS